MIAPPSYSATEYWRYAARNPSRIDFGSKSGSAPFKPLRRLEWGNVHIRESLK